MKIRDFDIQALPNDPEILKGVIVDMKQQLDYFLEQLNLAKARQFAASSEKSPDQFDFLFNEAESLADAEPEVDETEQAEPTKTAKKAGRKPLPAELPRKEIIHDISDAEKICACCNGALHKMGEERSEQLEFIPASIEVRVNIRPKYSCRHCEKVGVASQIIIAALPFNPIPKSIATPRLLAFIISSKFQFSLPLYRQESVFKQYGIELSRQTLANWMMKSFDYFEPFISRLKIHLLDQKAIHADETICQVLNEDRQQCYMWIYCSGADSPQSSVHKNIVLYDYQPTRAGAGPRNYLSDYEGYAHVDGYAAYEQLPNVRLVGCWAHARRKFVEAQKAVQSAAKFKQKTGKADWAISHIQKLYRIETSLKGQSEQAIYQARQTQSRPLVEQFKAWLDSSANSVLPKSAMGKAVQYCLNQWHKLERYLESGLLSIDNNRAERAAKSFVIGRKNWMFSNTARGARASAGLYSLVETAKVNGLDPTKYLEHLFNELHRCQTDAEMDTLMPWAARL